MTDIKEINLSEPNPDTIEMLESILAEARAGEVVGFVGVKMYREGLASITWMDPAVGRTGLRNDNVLGAMERIRFRMLCGRYDVETEDMLFEEDKA